MFRSGRRLADLATRPSNLATLFTTLIISNEEMEDIIKIVKSLEESGI